MNFKCLYQALFAILILSANLFAAGNMPLGLAFEGNGGVGVISKVRLANPNDPTFAGCRLNFGGQMLEFGATGGEVILSRPIGYDDKIPSQPSMPFLQSADPMTVQFVKTVPENDSPITEKAYKKLPIAIVVVRLDEVYPTLAELESAAIQSVKTQDDLPVYNYSAIKHLIKIGKAHECRALDALIFLTGQLLEKVFTTGCLELAFSPVEGVFGGLKKVCDKVKTNTDQQLPLEESVKPYQVIMDIQHNLSVSFGNYARELVCNN
jgi:hypothetical protein